MPKAPLAFCATHGCPNRVRSGHCAAHRKARGQAQDSRRGTRHQRGYTNRWALYSRKRLAQHPWCVGYPAGMHKPGRVLAECTDHIISAKAQPDLFWEETNHQSLCLDCNRRKNVAEEGANP